ncbi:MAG TPA: ABC transporter permease [Gemmatimonadaceae bacterium]|nr:ABC transporter permease [Gemmatimonadaceae bacterium]
MTPGRDFGRRCFRALLLLYPRSFRARFGDEMLEFFLQRRDEQRRRGPRGVARFWMHLVLDIVFNAPTQHVRALRVTTARDLPWAAIEYPEETRPMQTIRQDVRYALRTLRRYPAFAAVAVITLALGIGATTAIYSVVDAVLLRPLPWPESDRIVIAYGSRGSDHGGLPYLDYLDWRAQNKSFEELGVIRGQSVNLTGSGTPERLIGSFVTAGTFRLLGASAERGRLLTDVETEVATKEPVVVINGDLWRTRFGSRPDILGSTMTLNGQQFVIVGVMRQGYQEPLGSSDVWMPIGYYPNKGDLTTRGRPGVLPFGRLKRGVSVAAAQHDLDAVTSRLAALYPNTNAGTGAYVQAIKSQIVGDAQTPLLIVLAAVAAVLLIACANVANLQLARAAARGRELSVRAALGAGRTRLLRQLLTESLVLSVAGGAVGVAVAYAGVRWLGSVVPSVLNVFGTVRLDAGVLVFAALVTIATGVLFGVAPAWQASRARLQDALVSRTSSGTLRLGGRSALVVGQIALCVVLLVTTGLLTRSLLALAGVRPGFDPAGLLTLQFRLPASKYDTETKIADMFTRAIGEVRQVPGVEHAALVRATPLNGNGESFPYEIDGRPVADRATLPTAQVNLVSSDYFETVRIPRLSGRDFTAADRAETPPVVIVNRQLASKLSGDGDVIGKRVRLADGDSARWATVVGVVGDARHFQLTEQPLDQIYLPYTQRPLIFTEMVIRTAGDPMSVASAVRSAIWRVDADQPVWRVRPLTQSITTQLGGRSFVMRLLASFAVLALVLAIVGVYGVMSYAVARRTQEMGIRMALGARATQVVGMVLKQGMRTIAVALALGLVLAVLATRLLTSQLYGVAALDPLTFVMAPVLLATIALVACYLPARRASRVDPVAALKSD